MSLPHGILGFLYTGSMTGYDLAKAFHSSVNFFWPAQTSQIYLELNKLEKKQLVRSNVVVQTVKPNKRVYSITQAGKDELFNWLSGGMNDLQKDLKTSFLMKVFFSGYNSAENNIHMLTQFSKECSRYLESMKEIPETIAFYGEAASAMEILCWEFTADYGASYIQMCIDWSKRCIQRLEELS